MGPGWASKSGNRCTTLFRGRLPGGLNSIKKGSSILSEWGTCLVKMKTGSIPRLGEGHWSEAEEGLYQQYLSKVFKLESIRQEALEGTQRMTSLFRNARMMNAGGGGGGEPASSVEVKKRGGNLKASP